MTFTVTGVQQCPANEHLILTVQVNGGQTIEVRTSFDEMRTIGSDLDIRDLGLLRLKSAIKEAGATTKLQIRNAVLNQTFEI